MTDDQIKTLNASDLRTMGPSYWDHELPHPDLDQTVEAFEAGDLRIFEHSPNRDQNSYTCVDLENGKMTGVHRLVVSAAIGFWLPRSVEVDHIDRNPSNNTLANLRAVSSQDNIRNRRFPLDWKSVNAKEAERLNREKRKSRRRKSLPVPTKPSGKVDDSPVSVTVVPQDYSDRADTSSASVVHEYGASTSRGRSQDAPTESPHNTPVLLKFGRWHPAKFHDGFEFVAQGKPVPDHLF